MSGLVNHNAYGGCPFCHQVGEYIKRRIAYDTKAGKKRTDAEFRAYMDKIHHHRETPWATCPFIDDLIWMFPADTMHLLDLGVMKKMLELIMDANFIDLEKAENLITNVKAYLPDDFSRKVRTLKEFEHFKSTEFRFFALYFGPLFFLLCCKNQEVTQHFLLFFISYRLLMGNDNEVTEEANTIANLLLQSFVTDFARLYGAERVSSNVHTLLHLSEMVEKNGPIDNFSCYKYENFYQLLSSWIRKPGHYFIQVARRWVQTKGKTMLKNKGQRSFDANVIRANKKDCCVMLNCGSIFIITKILNTLTGIIYKGHKYLQLENVFETPIKSSELDIFLASKEGGEETVKPEQFSKKMLRLPCNNNTWMVLPILHSKFE